MYTIDELLAIRVRDLELYQGKTDLLRESAGYWVNHLKDLQSREEVRMIRIKRDLLIKHLVEFIRVLDLFTIGIETVNKTAA